MSDPTRSTCTLDDTRSQCSLDDTALKERLSRIRDEIAPRVVHQESRPGVRLWFPADARTCEQVEAWVALERECCAGFDWSVAHDDASDRLRLDIHGLDPGSPWLDALASSPSRSSRGVEVARAARAGGIGLVLSLVTFCGLPILAAALFGSTVVGALASLDDPRWIAVGAIGIGLVAWGGLRWRARRRPSGARAC